MSLANVNQPNQIYHITAKQSKQASKQSKEVTERVFVLLRHSLSDEPTSELPFPVDYDPPLPRKLHREGRKGERKEGRKKGTKEGWREGKKGNRCRFLLFNANYESASSQFYRGNVVADHSAVLLLISSFIVMILFSFILLVPIRQIEVSPRWLIRKGIPVSQNRRAP